MQRRRTFTLLLMLNIILLSNGCTSDTVRPSSNGNNANTGGVGNNSTGSREGIGPKDTGIGGTSEGNANSAVKSNSNVEPSGINKNAGRGAPANSNQP
ncbi:MAG TPA: hypothetical protein VGB76_21625 [Pyrinomonadaceae bacterium]